MCVETSTWKSEIWTAILDFRHIAASLKTTQTVHTETESIGSHLDSAFYALQCTASPINALLVAVASAGSLCFSTLVAQDGLT